MPKPTRARSTWRRVKAMSDEEIEQAIEMIKAMVDQKLGEKAKVVEGVAEPVSEPGPRRKAKRLAALTLTEPDDDGDNDQRVGRAEHVSK